MKKLLLTTLCLMAISVAALAGDVTDFRTLLFTTEGNAVITDEDENEVMNKPLVVEVYSLNALVIRAWEGNDGTDLYIEYNDGGQVTYVANIVGTEIQKKTVVADSFGVFHYEQIHSDENTIRNIFFEDDDYTIYYECSALINTKKETGEINFFYQDLDDNEFRLHIEFDGSTPVGISSVSSAALSSPAFNLQGQTVAPETKGIIINRNQKRLQK